MTCPMCDCSTVVVDSRSFGDFVRRRRKCSGCGHRFTTVEIDKDIYDRIMQS